MIDTKYIDRLQLILEKNNVCESHGITHAIKVYEHANNALYYVNEITDDDKLAVLFASLLHDADDKKFFPKHRNYENLRCVMDDINTNILNNVIRMVELVSASKNGDSIPDDIKDNQWMLIPRYADRLEAIGIIGISRCWQYTKTIKNPLYLETTERAIDENDLWTNIATEERYKKYNGNSVSMIDHFYDKLLRLTIFPLKNKYFDNMCVERRKSLIIFLLDYGKTGIMTDDIITDFIAANDKNIDIFSE